ncbi:MAG TPA: AcvB/VirJ family lysyl-phosphatidylglycerol hydrolase, partial [Thermoanaerobaculia bacterium]|nr:AcvB/VirJ family lysyl-phosphatidylglycerol hydrolase [Thermoanaerobaculia bacterium]
SSASDLPVLPEVKKLAGKPRLLCMYGEQESASICPTLDPKLGQKIGFSGAHHFGGNYETLADRILKELPATSSSGRP